MKALQNTIRLTLPVALCLLFVFSCGKHKYTKEDLSPALAKHFINIRWGKYAQASGSLDEELRGAFVEHWVKQVRMADVQDIDVAATVFNDAGDKADVTLNITWVLRVQQTVRTDVVTQEWLKTENGWQPQSFVALPLGASSFGGQPQ